MADYSHRTSVDDGQIDPEQASGVSLWSDWC